MSDTLSPRERFLAAIQGKPTDRPAIGTVTSVASTAAMAACGAFFPQAHREPAAMARLAACTSLDAGFDMIFPLFSVVHEAAALGADIHWGDAQTMPGVTRPLWREPDEIRIPEHVLEQEGMRVPLEALRLLKTAYGDEYAIVGKVFGPWSLSFHLFGVENILMMVLDDPAKLSAILQRLRDVTVQSALAQIEAGADLLCVGDHCSRDMCSPQTYRDFLLPLHQQLAAEIPCPLVLHTCGDTADRIEMIARSGVACFHYDTRVPAETARHLAGRTMALMGGVGNIDGLLPGNTAMIRAQVHRALAAGVNVIGPECAIPLSTTLESLRAIRHAVLEKL